MTNKVVITKELHDAVVANISSGNIEEIRNLCANLDGTQDDTWWWSVQMAIKLNELGKTEMARAVGSPGSAYLAMMANLDVIINAA